MSAIRDMGLVGHGIVGVAGVVQDGHPKLDRELHNREDDRVGAHELVIKFDADEPLVTDAAANLIRGLTLVAGVNVAVTEYPAAISLRRLGDPLVALAESCGRRRSSWREDRATKLVDPQPVRRGDQLGVVRFPGRPAPVREVGVAVDDFRQAAKPGIGAPRELSGVGTEGGERCNRLFQKQSSGAVRMKFG